jgi:hypothetical protein
MTSPAPALAWWLLPPVVLASAGLAWRDCTLLGLAAVAAHRLFLWRMDAGAPWEAWRAALRCLWAGLAAIAAALVLLVFVVGGLAGAWAMRHDPQGPALNLLALGSLFLGALMLLPSGPQRRDELLFWAGLLAVAALLTAPGGAGLGFWPCMFSLLICAGLVAAGWRLAHHSTRELLRAGQRD